MIEVAFNSREPDCRKPHFNLCTIHIVMRSRGLLVSFAEVISVSSLTLMGVGIKRMVIMFTTVHIYCFKCFPLTHSIFSTTSFYILGICSTETWSNLPKASYWVTRMRCEPRHSGGEQLGTWLSLTFLPISLLTSIYPWLLASFLRFQFESGFPSLAIPCTPMWESFGKVEKKKAQYVVKFFKY